MALPNPIKDLSRPNLTKGTWRAYVVDVQDPDKRQRVKIRIPQLHRDIPDSDLPWSMPNTVGQAHAGAGVGTVNVPPEGSLVEVWFEEDDPHNPRYGGSPPLDEVHSENELLQEDYPHTKGFVDEAGNKVTINTAKNEIMVQHKTGASFFIDGEGNITITAKKSLTFSGPEGINLTSGGNVNIHASGVTDVKGAPIHLNGNSAANQSVAPSDRPTPQIQSRKGQAKL